MPLGQVGSFDEKMVYTGNEPLIVGNEIWIYYGGHNTKHNDPQKEMSLSGIGLAKLRLDGFVSFQGKECTGNFMTKVLKFEGNSLFVNGKTAPDGFIGVELLDRDGNPIKGKTLKDCDKFTGDSLRKKVFWNGKGVGDLKEKSVRLKFYIKKGDIYSFQFI